MRLAQHDSPPIRDRDGYVVAALNPRILTVRFKMRREEFIATVKD